LQKGGGGRGGGTAKHLQRRTVQAKAFTHFLHHENLLAPYRFAFFYPRGLPPRIYLVSLLEKTSEKNQK